MKYMLLIETNQRAWDEVAAWSTEDMQRMFAHIAARISATPRPGGVPTNEPVEIHQVMGRPEV